MRKAMTEAEATLWNALRAHRFMGLGFRRQYPLGGYIADFACPSRKLIVEVDGSHHGHDDVLVYDRERDEALKLAGWTVLRFWNDDVLQKLDDVCSRILRTLEATP